MCEFNGIARKVVEDLFEFEYICIDDSKLWCYLDISSMFFLSARGAMLIVTSSIHQKPEISILISILPASIFERSRMSL
jgi:hypothetical protein